MDRMAVNAAIEQLINGGTEGWKDAAQLVVDFGVNIAPSGALIKQTGSNESLRSDEVTSGYSPGAGNVEVRTPAQQKTEEACSAPVERVGYYRVMHTQHIRVLRIEHYRQSGPFRKPAEDGDESGYVLTYTRDSKPDSFSLSSSCGRCLRHCVYDWPSGCRRSCVTCNCCRRYYRRYCRGDGW